MWFSAGFALLCGVSAYGIHQKWLLPVAIVITLLTVVLIGSSGKKNMIRPVVAVLAGGMAGLLWFAGYQLFYLGPVIALDGQEQVLTVTASDYSYETGYGQGVDGIVTLEGKTYQVRAYLRDIQSLSPGDRVEGTFRLWQTTVDEMNPSTYYQGKGIFLFAYQRGEASLAPVDDTPGWCFPAVLRQKLLTLLEEIFPEDTVAFSKALLLGDGRDLDYETNTAFKVSGIRHIIAVSGLHISILYGLICIVTLRKRYLTALVGMPVLLLFAAVAGFTPSVVRSCIMVWLMLLAMVFDRSYDPPTALGFAVLVMLLVNPMAVTSVSLQLSVSCVAGILLYNGPINSWLKEKWKVKGRSAAKVRAVVCGSISVTLSAMMLVTPLSACYFGTVSLVGLPANLLTLWVVNLVFNGLVVVCITYLLSPVAASVLASILSWPIRYVLGTAKLLASFPLAAVYTRSLYVVLWLIFVYSLLAVFLRMKKKQPGMLLCCGITGLCIALLASWAEPLTSDTRITMLDVGQGQAILLQSAGKTYLVDCGGDDDEQTADIVAETLLSQGIGKLDGMILTHYDRDHSGGLHHLLTRVHTDNLFLPDTRNDFAIPELEGETIYVWEDMELSFGDARLQIYGPVYSGLDNENSLCVLFDTEKCDILITGDRSAFGEWMLLRYRTVPDVDILVAGHHGAASSTSEDLLRAVTPEIVLISVAKNNIYDHPAPALLQRLEQFGCAVYRTDEHGTITIRR